MIFGLHRAAVRKDLRTCARRLGVRLPSRAEMTDKTILPPVLREGSSRDKEDGFSTPRYLGVPEMEFY